MTSTTEHFPFEITNLSTKIYYALTNVDVCCIVLHTGCGGYFEVKRTTIKEQKKRDAKLSFFILLVTTNLKLNPNNDHLITLQFIAKLVFF